MSNPEVEDVIFTRKAVAEILNCSRLTITNREKKGIYPEPHRGENDYRYYTITDIFYMQYATRGSIAVAPVLSSLYDRGYRDPLVCKQMIDEAKLSFQQMLEQGDDDECRKTISQE